MGKKRAALDPNQHVECQCPACRDEPLLRDVEDDLVDAWGEFLGGQWTLNRPDLSGVYPVASLDGVVAGLRRLEYDQCMNLVDKLQTHGEPGWLGYWWSVPLPNPPKKVPGGEVS